MNYRIIGIDNRKYIELLSVSSPICTEQDALDLIALCWEHDSRELMIHHEVFSEDFFQLKTKVAGNIIQKLTNYSIRVAAIVPMKTTQTGRFKEMASETNVGNHFRLFEYKKEAETWLLHG